jgi:HK97 family phage major capsid protein
MMRKLHELFTSSSAPEQILTDIYGTVIDAVKTKLIGTNFIALRLGPESCPGNTLNIVRQTKNSMVTHQVGEGQEIPISTEDTYYFSVTPDKYGLRPLITREMQEDSQFAVMERNLAEAGYTIAKTLDKDLILKALDNAGATTSGGTAITVANITESIYDLETADYTPTDFVIGAIVANDLRNIDTFVEANKAGVSDPSKSLIGTIYGMKVWQSNNVSNSLYAYVIDKSQALYLLEKRPITIERYNDVTRQMDGIVLSARWAAGIIPDASGGTTTSAISRITTS